MEHISQNREMVFSIIVSMFSDLRSPGQVLLPTAIPHLRCVGMLAIGSGGLTVAKGMLGDGFKMTTPKVLNIKLIGKLQPGVSAKDVALEVMRILTEKADRLHTGIYRRRYRNVVDSSTGNDSQYEYRNGSDIWYFPK